MWAGSWAKKNDTTHTIFQQLLNKKLKPVMSWVLVAHACNPSYSGGRDQENHGSKPAQGNSSQDPI
jgi:hypothetical protein